MNAEHLDFDTYWKVTRGNSIVLEGYKDEIATSKHKAARTLVHKLAMAALWGAHSK